MRPEHLRQGAPRMNWFTILIIVLIVLLLVGFFGRGRFRA
jgi:Sec-independent protein translocase protein TatA